MAEISGTLPAIKERPKVSKRPTIVEGAGAELATPPPSKADAGEKLRSPATNWINWAPVAVGIALGFLAPQLRAVAAQWDPWGLRIAFPLVQVIGLHELGFSDESTRTLPQLMLYLQFPLEGLLVASSLRRGRRFSTAIATIAALHLVCGLVLWTVALGSSNPM